VRASIEMDLSLIDHYDARLTMVDLTIVRTAKQHDANVFYRLRSVPGIGKILALVSPWPKGTQFVIFQARRHFFSCFSRTIAVSAQPCAS
ncbi:MAG: hypothetical protein HY699_20645, partial [Deltaproteobacteria bacterium]|nr:hypothetical protein [Deltaproteobacteria bacterium]